MRHALSDPSVCQKHSAAADIASSLSEDQVPEAFLVMLLIQFSTMIIDRALYLRKAVLGKLIFQVPLGSFYRENHISPLHRGQRSSTQVSFVQTVLHQYYSSNMENLSK